MGQFTAGYSLDAAADVQLLADSHNPRDNEIEIRGITVVSDTYGSDAKDFCPPDQFRRDQDAIAENGMGVKINHSRLHLVFAKIVGRKLLQVFLPFHTLLALVPCFRLSIEPL